jgi:hypothetical protein
LSVCITFLQQLMMCQCPGREILKDQFPERLI